jgi:hypothetical protein
MSETRPEADGIVPATRVTGRIIALFATADPKDFVTAQVERLSLRLDGLVGDRHAGFERASSSREPWYPRRTPIRNDRQLSIVSAEELAEIARRLALADVDPRWIGANLVVEGIPRLSLLPRGTRLVAGEAAIRVEDQNAPCRIAGRSLARHAGRDDLELGFPREAKRLRGVVASVERAGAIAVGDAVTALVPEQWIYRA